MHIATGERRKTKANPNVMLRAAAMLSTAMLLSATARSGFSPICAQDRKTCTAVVVLPVPGGPWIMVPGLR